MSTRLYNPFEDFQFNQKHCFLSGGETNFTEEEKIPVFPHWLIERYSLHDKEFTMLGGNTVKYGELEIPCSRRILDGAVNPLEEEIENAFSAGYEAVKKVPELRLFQWMAKLVYGILYHDIVFAISECGKKEKKFSLSPLLTNKFKNLHLMLQSLVAPIAFIEPMPWSIEVVKIKYSKDVFNYKDETNNLNFSLGMNDFGIIACLQDNGENGRYHQNLVEKIANKTLHPIQFEELCGRFIYSNYLLNTSCNYDILSSADKVFIKAASVPGNQQSPVFKKWDDNMFAQVLANYWKPWGFSVKDIISFPNPPTSYLINEYNNEIIESASIILPG
ncbi:MAG: hypothetical protein ABI472_06010 [Ginsengibacter sp.]